MHHDWLFNFRALQLRLYSTETIMQLAEFIINVIKLYEMPTRLKTSRNIISRRKKKKGKIVRKIVGLHRWGTEIISYIFHAPRRPRHHSPLTLVSVCARKKKITRGRNVFQFRFRFKNRKPFWNRIDFRLRDGKKHMCNTEERIFAPMQLRP